MPTFAESVARSNTDAVVLVELDIGQFNELWVNEGAGIWHVNFENSYPYIDSSLLDGFTAQSIVGVGSVLVDGVRQTKVETLAEVTTTDQSWYYNRDTDDLYVRLVNYDEPFIHDVSLGIIYGYSFDWFTPEGATQSYEGRLVSVPELSKSRDPLFFGRLQFGGGTVTLQNGDGELDTFGEDEDIYGNEARIYFGYKDLDIDEYVLLYTGYIDRVSIGEEQVTVDISDKRRQFTKPILYDYCNAQNALDAIVEIFTDFYDIPYTANQYDTTAWTTAQALAPTVTIDMQTEAPAIDIIEGICVSCFGLFDTTNEGKFTFKFIDTSVSAQSTIYASDILSRHTIGYDPTEVVSSVKVNYAKDWGTDEYDTLTDDTYERAVYLKYKTYNERTFDTYLDTVTQAGSLATAIMTYVKDVHGTLEVRLPMSYYALEVGDIVDAEINRSVNEMLGTKKCEVVKVAYALNEGTMTVGLRIV
jgi:hypothetical protein